MQPNIAEYQNIRIFVDSLLDLISKVYEKAANLQKQRFPDFPNLMPKNISGSHPEKPIEVLESCLQSSSTNPIVNKGDIFNSEYFMRIISLVSDFQDGTQFSKLVVCEDSFIKMLNIINTEDAEEIYKQYQERNQPINFVDFNSKNIKISGLYGSQDTICRFLEKQNMTAMLKIKQNPQLANLLTPGVYLYQVNKQEFYLICWINDIYTKIDVSFRTINVSIIRYVYDLSANFVILLGDDEEKKIDKKIEFKDFLNMDKIDQIVGSKQKEEEEFKIENLGNTPFIEHLSKKEHFHENILNPENIKAKYEIIDSFFSLSRAGIQVITKMKKKKTETFLKEEKDIKSLIPYFSSLNLRHFDYVIEKSNINERNFYKNNYQYLIFLISMFNNANLADFHDNEQIEKEFNDHLGNLLDLFFNSIENSKNFEVFLKLSRNFSEQEKFVMQSYKLIEINGYKNIVQFGPEIKSFEQFKNKLIKQLLTLRKYFTSTYKNSSAIEEEMKRLAMDEIQEISLYFKLFKHSLLNFMKAKVQKEKHFLIKLLYYFSDIYYTFDANKKYILDDKIDSVASSIIELLTNAFKKLLCRENNKFHLRIREIECFETKNVISFKFSMNFIDDFLININSLLIDQSEVFTAEYNTNLKIELKNNNTFSTLDLKKLFMIISLEKGNTILLNETEKNNIDLYLFTTKEPIYPNQKPIYSFKEDYEDYIKDLWIDYVESTKEIVIVNKYRKILRILKIMVEFNQVTPSPESPSLQFDSFTIEKYFPVGKKNKSYAYCKSNDQSKPDFFAEFVTNKPDIHHKLHDFPVNSYNNCKFYDVYLSKVKDIMNLIYYDSSNSSFFMDSFSLNPIDEKPIFTKINYFRNNLLKMPIHDCPKFKEIEIGNQTHLFYLSKDKIGSILLKYSGNIKGPQSFIEKKTMDKTVFEGPVFLFFNIYYIFQNFCTVPALIESDFKLENASKSEVKKRFIIGTESNLIDSNIKFYKNLIEQILKNVSSRLYKNMTYLKIYTEVIDWNNVNNFCNLPNHDGTVFFEKSGEFFLKLISSVPIQIARIENYRLCPLLDGISPKIDQILNETTYLQYIGFGLYEYILKNTKLPIFVISVMGLQKMGKSFLMNHLGGSYFDVAASRTTDGIWMSMCVTQERVVVLMDFEGLGTFVRNQNEDKCFGIVATALSDLLTNLFSKFESGDDFLSLFKALLAKIKLSGSNSLQKNINDGKLNELRNYLRNTLYAGCFDFKIVFTEKKDAFKLTNGQSYRKYKDKKLITIKDVNKMTFSFNGKNFEFEFQDEFLVISYLCAPELICFENLQNKIYVDNHLSVLNKLQVDLKKLAINFKQNEFYCIFESCLKGVLSRRKKHYEEIYRINFKQDPDINKKIDELLKQLGGLRKEQAKICKDRNELENKKHMIAQILNCIPTCRNLYQKALSDYNSLNNLMQLLNQKRDSCGALVKSIKSNNELLSEYLKNHSSSEELNKQLEVYMKRLSPKDFERFQLIVQQFNDYFEEIRKALEKLQELETNFNNNKEVRDLSKELEHLTKSIANSSNELDNVLSELDALEKKNNENVEKTVNLTQTAIFDLSFLRLVDCPTEFEAVIQSNHLYDLDILYRNSKIDKALQTTDLLHLIFEKTILLASDYKNEILLTNEGKIDFSKEMQDLSTELEIAKIQGNDAEMKELKRKIEYLEVKKQRNSIDFTSFSIFQDKLFLTSPIFKLKKSEILKEINKKFENFDLEEKNNKIIEIKSKISIKETEKQKKEKIREILIVNPNKIKEYEKNETDINKLKAEINDFNKMIGDIESQMVDFEDFLRKNLKHSSKISLNLSEKIRELEEEIVSLQKDLETEVKLLDVYTKADPEYAECETKINNRGKEITEKKEEKARIEREIEEQACKTTMKPEKYISENNKEKILEEEIVSLQTDLETEEKLLNVYTEGDLEYAECETKINNFRKEITEKKEEKARIEREIEEKACKTTMKPEKYNLSENNKEKKILVEEIVSLQKDVKLLDVYTKADPEYAESELAELPSNEESDLEVLQLQVQNDDKQLKELLSRSSLADYKKYVLTQQEEEKESISSQKFDNISRLEFFLKYSRLNIFTDEIKINLEKQMEVLEKTENKPFIEEMKNDLFHRNEAFQKKMLLEENLDILKGNQRNLNEKYAVLLANLSEQFTIDKKSFISALFASIDKGSLAQCQIDLAAFFQEYQNVIDSYNQILTIFSKNQNNLSSLNLDSFDFVYKFNEIFEKLQEVGNKAESFKLFYPYISKLKVLFIKSETQPEFALKELNDVLSEIKLLENLANTPLSPSFLPEAKLIDEEITRIKYIYQTEHLSFVIHEKILKSLKNSLDNFVEGDEKSVIQLLNDQLANSKDFTLFLREFDSLIAEKIKGIVDQSIQKKEKIIKLKEIFEKSLLSITYEQPIVNFEQIVDTFVYVEKNLEEMILKIEKEIKELRNAQKAIGLEITRFNKELKAHSKIDLDINILKEIESENQRMMNDWEKKVFNFYQLCGEKCSHYKTIHKCNGEVSKCKDLCTLIICNLKCVKLKTECERDTGINHNCKMFDEEEEHLCPEYCSECKKLDIASITKCSNGAGHEQKFHLCREKEHKCKNICSFATKNGCSHNCVIPITEDHKECLCELQTQHKCMKPCEKNGCTGQCSQEWRHSESLKHLCQTSCAEKCKLCVERKATSYCSKPHYHTNKLEDQDHQCEGTHNCLQICQEEGYCDIKLVAALSEPPSKENGWIYKTSEKGEKYPCQIEIPKNKLNHEGKHLCVTDVKDIKTHYCGNPCKQCLYMCREAKNHKLLCKVKNHGTMGNTFLNVSQGQKLEISDLSKGELKTKVDMINQSLISSGIVNGFALTCLENCEIFGRGHIHPIKCNGKCKEKPLIYNHNGIYDYMSCKNYFEHYLNFERVCQKEEYNKCGYQCGHSIHLATKDKPKVIKYCIEETLHQKLNPPFYKKYDKNYVVSQDGHAFDCTDHSSETKMKIQIIVCLDSSGSMCEEDVVPNSNQFQNNRYGAVLECLNKIINKIVSQYNDPVCFLTYVDFTNDCQIILENVQCFTDIVINKNLNSKFRKGLTDFNVVLNKSVELIEKYKTDFEIFLFLSDGYAEAKDDVLKKLNETTTKIKPTSVVIGIKQNDDPELEKIANNCYEGRYETVKNAFLMEKFLVCEVFESIKYGNYGFYVKPEKIRI